MTKKSQPLHPQQNINNNFENFVKKKENIPAIQKTVLLKEYRK